MKWESSSKSQSLPAWIVQFRETEIPNIPRLTLISDYPLVRYEGAKYTEDHYIPISPPSAEETVSTKRTYSPCMLSVIITLVAIVAVTAITLSVLLTISRSDPDYEETSFNMSLTLENRKFIPEMLNLSLRVTQVFSFQVCRSILYRLNPINSKKLCNITNLTNGSVLINFNIKFYISGVDEARVTSLLEGFNTWDTFQFSRVRISRSPSPQVFQNATARLNVSMGSSSLSYSISTQPEDHIFTTRENLTEIPSVTKFTQGHSGTEDMKELASLKSHEVSPSINITKYDDTILYTSNYRNIPDISDVTTAGNTFQRIKITMNRIDYISPTTQVDNDMITDRDVLLNDSINTVEDSSTKVISDPTLSGKRDISSHVATNYDLNNEGYSTTISVLNHGRRTRRGGSTLSLLEYYLSTVRDVSTATDMREISTELALDRSTSGDDTFSELFSESVEVNGFRDIVTKPLTSMNYETGDYNSETKVQISETESNPFNITPKIISTKNIHTLVNHKRDYSEISGHTTLVYSKLSTPEKIFTGNDLISFDKITSEKTKILTTTPESFNTIFPAEEGSRKTEVSFTSKYEESDKPSTLYDSLKQTQYSTSKHGDITSHISIDGDNTANNITPDAIQNFTFLNNRLNSSFYTENSNKSHEIKVSTPIYKLDSNSTSSYESITLTTTNFTKSESENTKDIINSTEYDIENSSNVIDISSRENIETSSPVSVSSLMYQTLKYIITENNELKSENNLGKLSPMNSQARKGLSVQKTKKRLAPSSFVLLTPQESHVTTKDVLPNLLLKQDYGDRSKIICLGNNISGFKEISLHAAASEDEPELIVSCIQSICNISSWWKTRVQTEITITVKAVHFYLTFSSNTCSASKQFTCSLFFFDQELVKSENITVLVPPKKSIIKNKKGISPNLHTEIECLIIGAQLSSVWLETRQGIVSNFNEYNTAVTKHVIQAGCFYESSYQFGVKFSSSYNLSTIRCAFNYTSNYKTLFTNEVDLKLLPEDYCADGHIFKAYPFDNCSESYVHCANNFSYVANCPDGHCIDADIGLCVKCDCNESKQVTGAYEINKSTLRYEDCLYECSCIAGGTDFDHAALRGNCTHYIYCNGESEHVIACPNGYFYNNEAEQGTIPCERTTDNCTP